MAYRRSSNLPWTLMGQDLVCLNVKTDQSLLRITAFVSPHEVASERECHRLWPRDAKTRGGHKMWESVAIITIPDTCRRSQ